MWRSTPTAGAAEEPNEIVTRNPRMTPAANTRTTPIAAATMMRSTPASAPLPTDAGHRRAPLVRPRRDSVAFASGLTSDLLADHVIPATGLRRTVGPVGLV